MIDFGSAIAADPDKPRPYYDLFFGTSAYAASEILRKLPYQAAPAEVWTLGILLSYLLTGSSPFASERDAIEGRITLTGADHQSGREPLVVSAAALDLMKRCLVPNPARRADIVEVRGHIWLDGTLG